MVKTGSYGGAPNGAGGTALLDGADSYVVRDGRIAAQTIHYRVERDGPSAPDDTDVPRPRAHRVTRALPSRGQVEQ